MGRLGLRRAGMLALLALLAGLAGTAFATTVRTDGSPQGNSHLQKDAKAAEDADDLDRASLEWAAGRVSPATTVDATAFSDAFSAACMLSVSGGSWSELTTKKYDSDDPDYRDFASNSGGGAGLVTGRATALAVSPTDPNTVFVGTAGGGVWKTTNGGSSWAPVFDEQDTTAIGAMAFNPADNSLWVGTGENNIGFSGYYGQGVYRSGDGGATWQHVGGTELKGAAFSKLEFDGAGHVYAATTMGLFRRSTADLTSPWQKVLDAPMFGYAPVPYGMSFVDDVDVQPGTNGQVVVAAMAWRAPTEYNGFYVSRDGGAHFSRVDVSGAINPKSLGRSTLTYSADGSKLYALVESTFLFTHGTQTGNTVLDGVFVSKTGDPAGPWNQIADYRKLQQSGSALKLSKGYSPGVQAWYNQFLGVDPSNSDHVYVGLEEVFETTNGGSTWHTIGPYWNFPFSCWSIDPAQNTCPDTTHPDQHAIAFAAGKVYVGNDGGVYSRSLTQAPDSVAGWSDLNASLRSLQYYYAGSANAPAGNGHGAGELVYGGMQDNGVSLLAPGRATMGSPFGGDGGDIIADPANGDRAVVEYTSLDMWRTSNSGYSPKGTIQAFTEMTPSCGALTYTPPNCDPTARFIAPFEADPKNVDHWVAGGRYLWDNGGKGWSTSCSATACDWTRLDDSGSGHAITAIGINGSTVYTGWCGTAPLCYGNQAAPDVEGFTSGLRTNYGGTWHAVTASGLPNRYVNSILVDPANAAHAYAVYGAFTRRWIPDAGQGHLFETKDGGAIWTNISGNLPDAPADDLLLLNGTLVLATDVGVFVASASTPTSWSRYGTGLPHAAVVDLSPRPDGSILAATHGRGLWTIPAP